MKLVIKNGRVMDPASGRDEVTNIWVEDEKIIGFGEHPEWAEEAEKLNAEGCVVAPGLVDVHVHFRDPGFTYKEDLETGSRAASAGGFTTVVCMANTKPIVDTPEVLQDILERAKSLPIHVKQASAVSKNFEGKELVDFDAMVEAGTCGFTDDGIPLTNAGFIKKAMEEAARVDMPISLHEEDPTLNEVNGVNKGVISDKMGIGGAPAISEDVMVARDCMLALHTGASVCIQHISSKNSVELVRLAKMLGADVHAEATPHHFTLTEEAVLKYGTLARMNPPLRTEEDRQAIIKGIQDGTIDMIVTDHAPHSEEEKAKPMAQAPSGITGLETSLALGIYSLVEPGYITLMDLTRLMSKAPAEFYRMVPGSITEGAPADLVIFGEHEQWTVDHFDSKAENSPFKGWTLPGKVHYTICAGKIVYRG